MRTILSTISPVTGLLHLQHSKAHQNRQADGGAGKWKSSHSRKKRTLSEVHREFVERTIHILGIAKRSWIPDYFRLSKKDVENVLSGRIKPTLTTFLSPLDPLVCDRKRSRELFGFDYRIECYTPADKRIYEYFTLPILHNGQLVGRMDAKAHRKDATPGDEYDIEFKSALSTFACWHGTPDILFCGEHGGDRNN